MARRACPRGGYVSCDPGPRTRQSRDLPPTAPSPSPPRMPRPDRDRQARTSCECRTALLTSDVRSRRAPHVPAGCRAGKRGHCNAEPPGIGPVCGQGDSSPGFRASSMCRRGSPASEPFATGQRLIKAHVVPPHALRCRMAPMGKKLTEAQIERYHRDGFVYPIDAFAAEEARRYRRAMEEFEAAQGRELTKGHNFKPHLLFTWVDGIVHHPAILDAVEDIIGPDIRLFHLSVWPKNAGDAAYVSWHQDATYFGLEPPLQVTAWVALTDASIEAGCMEVIPGSHKLGQLPHAERSEATHNLLSRGQTITAELDTSRTEFMPVRAGGGLSADDPRPGVGVAGAGRAAHAAAAARFRASNVEQTSRYASAVR